MNPIAPLLIGATPDQMTVMLQTLQEILLVIKVAAYIAGPVMLGAIGWLWRMSKAAEHIETLAEKHEKADEHGFGTDFLKSMPGDIERMRAALDKHAEAEREQCNKLNDRLTEIEHDVQRILRGSGRTMEIPE